MRITQVRILSRGRAFTSADVEAEVELDGVLTLRGIHVRNSRCGPFLVFPAQGTRSFVDLIQPAFAKSLRQSILDAWRSQKEGSPSLASALA